MTEIAATPQKLYLLRLSTSTVPLPSGRTLDMVLGCYLVELSDGRHVLVDTGYPADAPPSPALAQPENVTNVIEQLRDLGLSPQDIDFLICTHFDIDHVGYHDAFTRAELIVQREHYELARSGHPRYSAARAHWDHPALHYRLIEGDTEILPGLTLIKTSGHTPAHQSVLVRLPRTGPVLLAIDAVMMQQLFTADRPASPADDNAEQLVASTTKLLELVEREAVALVIFGHDGQQWRTLRTAPEYYE